jgi:SEC-C motif
MSTHADLLSTYQHIREVSYRLNNKLVTTLSTETLHEGGRRLGILKGDILVFDTEDQSSVLMDYCIYNVYVKGRNAAQRYLEDSPPPAGSDEMAALKAQQKAYYSINQVLSVERGVGVNVRDVLRGDPGFIMDIGFGSTATVGMAFAGRVVPSQGFLMSGGASLPVVGPAGERIADGLKRMFDPSTDFTRLTPDQEADLAAMVIRACIETGSASRIVYATPGEPLSQGRVPSSGHERVRANRNDPCPCGSGRKYRSCHGKR